MRVTSIAQQTVVFIGSETSGSFGPVGTGFLAKVRRKGHDFNFVVTAEHILDLVQGDEIMLDRIEMEVA